MLSVEQLFFDSEKVLKAIGRAKAKALSKVGAFVRRRARSSMRRTKKSADTGKAPAAHAGQIKELLYFAYDFESGSVVVGPEKFRQGTVPKLLEKGGVGTRLGKGGKPITRTYKGNPFMAPALEAEVAAGTIPEQFRSSLE
jgi:hypothetical protein